MRINKDFLHRSTEPSISNKRNVSIFYILVYVIFSSNAISFYQSGLGWATMLFFSLLFSVLNKIKFDRKLLFSLLIWLIYCFLLLSIEKDFDLIFNHFVRYGTLILSSYVLIRYYGESLMFKFEKVILWLSVISLFFWLWSIVSFESLLELAKMLSIGESANNKERASYFYNFFVYSIEIFNTKEIFPRNYGFTMEPGLYACFLALAIFFNFYRNNFNLKIDLPAFVLLLALFTTRSTTGIVSLMIIVFYSILLNKSMGAGRFVLLIFFLLVFGFVFYKTSFLYEKILVAYNEQDIIEKNIDRRATWSTGRIGGLIVGYKNWKAYPILGMGPNSHNSYTFVNGADMDNTNGFAGIMSIFGSFGLFVYFYLATKSSRFFSRFYCNNLYLGFLILMTALLMGFSLYRSAIFFTFLFYGFFVKSSVLSKTKEA